jgi:hypothetical protein
LSRCEETRSCFTCHGWKWDTGKRCTTESKNELCPDCLPFVPLPEGEGNSLGRGKRKEFPSTDSEKDTSSKLP